jgi:hypothetical protein
VPSALDANAAALILVANYAVITRQVAVEPVSADAYEAAGIDQNAPGVAQTLAIYIGSRSVPSDAADLQSDFSVQKVEGDGADAATVHATIGLTKPRDHGSGQWVTHVLRIERRANGWVITRDQTAPA